MNRKTIVSTLTLAVMIFASMVGCTKHSAQETAHISFFTGKITLTRGSNTNPVQIKDQVMKGDRITTGENSFVIVQIPGEKLFRLEEKSSLVMTELSDLDKTILLEKGLVLSKISKLQKGENYQVKTPVAVAAVRGTEFLASYDGATSTVSVGNGKVEVTTTKKDFSQALDPGKSVVIAETADVHDATVNEKKELGKLEHTGFIQNVDQKNEQELRDSGEEMLKIEQKEEKEFHPVTLDDIRNKYKRIDVVTLYSGQVIKGAILSRGAKITLITVRGEVSFASKDIKRTESY